MERMNIEEINRFYMCECFKKIIQNSSFESASKILIAANSKYKEWVLICEGCFNFFLKISIRRYLLKWQENV